MIPVILVTGFLGAGKTTLLERMVASTPAGTVFLVNEFSPKDVDGRRLSLPQEGLELVSGGSIFCRCKATDFINAMQRIPVRRADCPRVVIEASGISDPGVFPRMLRETGLASLYTLARIISVLDPGTVFKLLKTLPNLRSQIAAASLIIINKADLHSGAEIEQARGVAREINPGAEIVVTSNCVVALKLLEGADAEAGAVCGEYAKCVDPNYAALTLQLPAPVDWARARASIGGELRELYRVKGVLRDGQAALEVDYSGGRWSERPAREEAAREGVLVIIAAGSERENLARLQFLCDSGAWG